MPGPPSDPAFSAHGMRPAGTAPVRGLDRFSGPVRTELGMVRERITDLLSGLTGGGAHTDTSARAIQAPVRHLFCSGGKLFRPLLVLLAARAAGDSDPKRVLPVVRAAAAVELIHTASLAHDDLIDGSGERRGVPSLHAAYGPTTAVLVGDLFYSRFFRELANLPGVDPSLRLRLLDTFLDVTGRMCEAEILADQLRADGRSPSLEEYLVVTEAKTAALVSASCLAGALLGGASEGAAADLGRYGRALGLLFQVADDLRDGDAAFTDALVLRAKAGEFHSDAEALLSGFPRNGAADMLRALPGHILSLSPS